MAAKRKWDKDRSCWLVRDQGGNWIQERQPPGWYPDPNGAKGAKRWWDGNQWTSLKPGEFNAQEFPVTVNPGFDGTTSFSLAVVSTTCPSPTEVGRRDTLSSAIADLQQQTYSLGGNAVVGLAVTGAGSMLVVTGMAVKVRPAPRPSGGGIGGFVGVSIPI